MNYAKIIMKLEKENDRLEKINAVLVDACDNLVRQARILAENYDIDDNKPIWAFIADAADAIAKAEPASNNDIDPNYEQAVADRQVKFT